MIMRKLAFLSDVNIDMLQPILKKSDEYELYFSAFNQWQSDLMNPDSSLHHFVPDVVFLFLLNDDIKYDFENDIKVPVDFFCKLHTKSKIFISDYFEKPYSVSSFISTGEKDAVLSKLIQYVAEEHQIELFRFSRLIQLYGHLQMFDDKFWYLGKIKLSQSGFRWLATEINHYFKAMTGNLKKVLVLDLDNTLWGDIVGETGWNKIILSNEGKGRIYKDFQRNILKLKDLGVLLTIVSKNNLDDVKEVFGNHPDMVMKWDDFVVHKINWDKKSTNLEIIANELNVGIDSLVFIDDNPREREEVKLALPEVSVPDFPEDITRLNFWFVNDVVYSYFPKFNLSVEDLNKTSQYQRQNQRREQQNKLGFEAYLNSLEMNLQIREAKTEELPRVLQLIQKTNQFNVHPVRLTESELADKLNDKVHRIFVLHYNDKFGDEGLTACAIVKIEEGQMTFEHFLLSCRILGRKVENQFLESIIEQINPQKNIIFCYEKTSKNDQVLTFLAKEGFKQTVQNRFIKQI